MISLTPPQGANIDLSFTISDDDLGKLLAYNAERRSKGESSIQPVVSSGNCQISVCDEAMETTPGMAAKVFRAAAKASADIRIITTSEYKLLYQSHKQILTLSTKKSSQLWLNPRLLTVLCVKLSDFRLQFYAPYFYLTLIYR